MRLHPAFNYVWASLRNIQELNRYVQQKKVTTFTKPLQSQRWAQFQPSTKNNDSTSTMSKLAS